jgi:hypothetical protein
MRFLTSEKKGYIYLAFGLIVTYVLSPLAIYNFFGLDFAYLKFSGISLFAVICLIVGAFFPLLDFSFNKKIQKFAINGLYFCTIIWLVFLVFAILAWATSPQIPLIAALNGADAETIAVLREKFLKSREGWQSSFVYINALLTCALIPYSLALLFLNNVRWRWLAATLFFIYCLSFMEKAYFLKCFIPLFYLTMQGFIKTRIPIKLIVVVPWLVIFAITFLSGSGTNLDINNESFFSASYIPQSPWHHLLWRIVAIPLVTSVDSIRVFYDQFGGEYLNGFTSSFISKIFSEDRIDFERLVFAEQWGQNETGTGSSNSVYIIEAFVNFGWIGVLIFSFITGQIMRIFAISKDKAFKSLWILFAFGVYSSGLIGTLLSNGFILVFIMQIFFRVKFRK